MFRYILDLGLVGHPAQSSNMIQSKYLFVQGTYTHRPSHCTVLFSASGSLADGHSTVSVTSACLKSAPQATLTAAGCKPLQARVVNGHFTLGSSLARTSAGIWAAPRTPVGSGRPLQGGMPGGWRPVRPRSRHLPAAAACITNAPTMAMLLNFSTPHTNLHRAERHHHAE